MISDIIDKILDGKDICSLEIAIDFKEIETHDEIDDYSNKALLYLTYFIISGKMDKNINLTSKEEKHKEFIDKVIPMLLKEPRLLNKSELEILTIIQKLNFSISRDLYILLQNYKTKISKSERNYDNREWIIKLLVYFTIIAFEELKFIETQKNIEILRTKYEDEPIKSNKKTWIRTIDDKKQENILKDANKPTVSIDEYVNLLMKQVKKFERKNAAENISNIKKEETFDSSDEESKLKRIREQDELNDEMKKGSGNRLGMG
ncbi:hypothetical protein EDEG_03803 [Edhazardia aedis USNM 41457]|uniref:Uncharacterized protein n=1 Tax=Edhazardia aedis (strain USNM 41457) TaxID=1003232 RepID=J9D1E1_EDHAE|nr:hypothetical protein EDEG_03803 [Edhazardia aedis USNM 41457]|eukprot:EJW01651.1 hypothetical protein EDEG_03803 [Edhazardia aedis USNM 41457]